MKRTITSWAALGIAAAIGAWAVQTQAAPAPRAGAYRPFPLAVTPASNVGGGKPHIYALGSGRPDAYNYDVRSQVRAYARLVHASYAEAAAMAAAMREAIDLFLAAPSPETLGAARKAWVAARPAYLKTEAFRFYDGPVEFVEGGINAWPLNEAFIDYVEGKPGAGLVNDATLPLDIAALAANNQKTDENNVTTGWHAIEFLLWGQDLSADGPGNRPYTDYIAGRGNNGRRREYLRLVTVKLVRDLDWLVAAWEPGKDDNHAAKFLALRQREALGRMLNGIAILTGFELMSERLAVALDSGDQEDEHSCFSDTTKRDFVYDLAGVKAVWTGDGAGAERDGLDQLLREQDAALADRIDALFAAAEAKIAALGDPWDQVLAKPKDSPERLAAEDAAAALQALAAGLSEAGAALGVLVQIPTG